MFVCVCMYVCTGMFASAFLCLCVPERVAYSHASFSMKWPECMCVYACVQVCMGVCVHVCAGSTSVYQHACASVCM